MARRRRRTPPSWLILDSGAVLALARHDPGVRAAFAAAIGDAVKVLVPAVVVAETVRGDGPRDAAINRVLNAVDEVVPVTEVVARTAGGLLAATASNATIDALIVAEAIQHGATIMTGDPDDLRSLAEGHPQVVIMPLA